MDRSTKVAHDRHKPHFNPQTQQLGEDMQVGDLVVSKAGGGDADQIGIIVGINPNGDCKVQIKEHVFLIHPQWLEVIA